MKWKVAAVIEPNASRWKALSEGLKKAGLKVSNAREVSALRNEQVVVLGTSAKSPSRLARDVRKQLPEAFVMAAMSKGFKAPFADAVLPLPISPNDLKVRLPELARAGAAAAEPTVRPGEPILDSVTNFYTFNHFKEVLFVEVKRARRYGFPLALAFIAFDPTPGATDAVRAQLMSGLSLAMRRSLRDTDYPVQFSADRVLLLMPHTDLAGALIVARRICDRVSKATLQVGAQLLQPTISVGVSAGDPGRDYSFSDLVKQAQDGLEASVSAGGNRVEFFDSVQGGQSSPGPSIGIPRIPPVALPPPPAAE